MNGMKNIGIVNAQSFCLKHVKHFIIALVLISFASLLLTWSLPFIEKEITWFIFYPAVILATLYGGIAAGFIATFLTPFTLFFIWPLISTYPLINNVFDLLEMSLFIIICSYISYLHGLLQRYKAQLVQSKQAHQSDQHEHQFITKLIDSMPNMIGYWDKELNCQFANKAFSEWHTQHPKDLIGISFKELAGEALYSLNEPHIKNVLAGKAQRFERTLQKTDGTKGSILAQYIPDFDSDGSVIGFAIQSSEVTELKETEAQLKLATCVFDSTVDGVLITDINGFILSVNPAFTHITGYSAEEAIGLTPNILKSYRQNDDFYTALWAELKKHGKWSGEIWNRRKSGDIFLVRLNISMVKDEEGKTIRYISVFSDITDLWHKDESLKHLAFYDALTDLPNRTLLMERLGQKIIGSKRRHNKLAVMFLDLDGFKLINDSFGHNTGDELLKVISSRLLDLVRQSDIVARLGGDEFIFVMDNPLHKEEILHLAERIINSIKEPIEIDDNHLQIGSSIGIAIYPDDATTSVDLIEKADHAMYQSKDPERSSIHFYESDSNQINRNQSLGSNEALIDNETSLKESELGKVD
ncbi:diguanylate cyclase domain-containing protein [Psychromonas arctica]|uniref:diguanylate cyclase domain-containing protein n=1 Tax=Psychromonas arctica TaxID=168275 RepID=UPI000425F63C|nr:diguanylate cyclase [Psychromonas arctica]